MWTCFGEKAPRKRQRGHRRKWWVSLLGVSGSKWKGRPPPWPAWVIQQLLQQLEGAEEEDLVAMQEKKEEENKDQIEKKK